jgi:hypothetical protein
MQLAFLRALQQRTQVPSKTVLPIGEVNTDELQQVLRALEQSQTPQGEGVIFCPAIDHGAHGQLFQAKQVEKDPQKWPPNADGKV